MNSQDLRLWNLVHPIGWEVTVKLPTGDSRSNPLPTKTRSTAYLLNGTSVVMVAGISTPVPLADVTSAKSGFKFPVQITTVAFDAAHLEAIRASVAAINAEYDSLLIELEQPEGDGTFWVTVSADTAQRIFHLGARVGKWLVEEGMASR